MTESEWLTSTDYLAMLIYLRGDVEAKPDERGAMPGLHCGAGYLAEGEATRVSRRKLRLFAAVLCQQWRTVPLDGTAQSFLVAYENFSNDSASWEQVIEAGIAVQEAVERGDRPPINQMAMLWTDTPCGAAHLGVTLAWAVADHLARESVAVTCKDATEEDRWLWGWGGGPPDALWQATRKGVEEKFPLLLRELLGNPFRPSPTLPPAVLAWNDGTVHRIAEGIYGERQLPVGTLDNARLAILADALLDAGCDDEQLIGHCRCDGPHVRGCWAVDLILGKS